MKTLLPIGAAIAAVNLDRTEAKLYKVDDLYEQLSPLAMAYIRACTACRESSCGNFIALSQKCDLVTAMVSILFC